MSLYTVTGDDDDDDMNVERALVLGAQPDPPHAIILPRERQQ